MGIWNLGTSGFWIAKKNLVFKWFLFQMGSEIWKPNHFKSRQTAAIFWKTIWNPDKNFNGLVFNFVSYISHLQPAQVDYRSGVHSWINRYPTCKSGPFIFFTFTTIGLGGYPYYTLPYLYKYYTTHGNYSASPTNRPSKTPRFTSVLCQGLNATVLFLIYAAN